MVQTPTSTTKKEKNHSDTPALAGSPRDSEKDRQNQLYVRYFRSAQAIREHGDREISERKLSCCVGCVAAEERRWGGEKKKDNGTRDSHARSPTSTRMLLCEAVKNGSSSPSGLKSGAILAETYVEPDDQVQQLNSRCCSH